MLRISLVMVAVALLATSCKKRARDDLSSPEKALASFFQALSDERLPRDINTFLIDDTEIALWKLRCESRGCNGGTFKVVTAAVEENTATLIVDYSVSGRGGQVVMRGKKSPILLERFGKIWKLAQFGNRVDQSGHNVAPGTIEASPQEADPNEL